MPPADLSAPLLLFLCEGSEEAAESGVEEEADDELRGVSRAVPEVEVLRGRGGYGRAKV